jgi:hypothetical protein
MPEHNVDFTNKTFRNPVLIDAKATSINQTEIPHAKNLLVDTDIGNKVQGFSNNLESISNSRFNKPGYIKTTGDGYFTVDQNRLINSNEDVQWVHGHLKVLSSDGIRTLVASGWPESKVPVENGLFRTGRALSFKDINILANFCGEIDSYTQVVIQNKTGGESSSADIVLANDITDSNSGYSNLGINSSSYKGDNAFDEPNGTYLYSTAGSLSLGSSTINNINIVTDNKIRGKVDGVTGDFEFYEKFNGLTREDFIVLKDIINNFKQS